MLGTYICEERRYRCAAGTGKHGCEWTLKIHSNSCSWSRTARSGAMCSDSKAARGQEQLRVLHPQQSQPRYLSVYCLQWLKGLPHTAMLNPWIGSWRLGRCNFEKFHSFVRQCNKIHSIWQNACVFQNIHLRMDFITTVCFSDIYDHFCYMCI